jgi:hypothetical protein
VHRLLQSFAGIICGPGYVSPDKADLEPPPMANAVPNIPPEDVETQRKRAFVASGLCWGLDGFDPAA